MKSTNFDYSEDQINSEFQVFMYLEDLKWSHVNIFELNYPHLDRYSDIKPFKHNIIKINARNKYINASPINIGNKKIYLYQHKVQSLKQLRIFGQWYTN